MARVKISDLVHQQKILEDKIKKIQIVLWSTVLFVAVFGYKVLFAI